MFQVYLNLGSNIGDRLKYLSDAIESINRFAPVDDISSVYETEPKGMINSNDFLNVEIKIKTFLFPVELFASLKKIEFNIAKRKHQHMQPREIDIDITLYDGYTYEDNTLQVPHPRYRFRRFVLEPLYEIAPTLVDPSTNLTIGALLRRCKDDKRVTRTNLTLNIISIHKRSLLDTIT